MVYQISSKKFCILSKFDQDFFIFTNNFGKFRFQIRIAFISNWSFKDFLEFSKCWIFGIFRGFFRVFGEVYEDFFSYTPLVQTRHFTIEFTSDLECYKLICILP